MRAAIAEIGWPLELGGAAKAPPASTSTSARASARDVVTAGSLLTAAANELLAKGALDMLSVAGGLCTMRWWRLLDSRS